MRLHLIPIALVTALLAALGVAPTPASAAAPNGFLGMNAEDIYAGNDDYQEQMLVQLHQSGVTVMRQNFRWGYTETAKGVFDWRKLDRYAIAAARHKMRLLPLLYGETYWATSRGPADQGKQCTFPPRNNQDYADFAFQVAKRYGRGGTLWAENPWLVAQPVLEYELWNEPNLKRFWKCAPNASEYVALARGAANALREADPKATIMSAGAPKKDVDTGKYFKAMIKAGARTVFNALALHSYRKHSGDMLDDLEAVRDGLDGHKLDDWPIYLTEWGWPTGGPPTDKHPPLSEHNQATAISHALAAFGKNRKRLKLKSTHYYSWADLPPPPGDDDYWGLHTGLLRIDLTPKKSLKAFADAGRAIK